MPTNPEHPPDDRNSDAIEPSLDIGRDRDRDLQRVRPFTPLQYKVTDAHGVELRGRVVWRKRW